MTDIYDLLYRLGATAQEPLPSVRLQEAAKPPFSGESAPPPSARAMAGEISAAVPNKADILRKRRRPSE